MKDKIFGVLQRVGRSFMLPIALLPVAGLLLGIGSSFTNETMLAAYGLNSVIHPGTLIYTILDVMSQTGSAVFNNLALLFAMGVAIGMARKEKEVAALSGAVAYIIMNTAIQAMINAAGGVDAMPANSTTTMLGITTLQMGVFGGIVVGSIRSSCRRCWPSLAAHALCPSSALLCIWWSALPCSISGRWCRAALPRWVHWCWLPATQAPLFTACWSVR